MELALHCRLILAPNRYPTTFERDFLISCVYFYEIWGSTVNLPRANATVRRWVQSTVLKISEPIFALRRPVAAFRRAGHAQRQIWASFSQQLPPLLSLYSIQR